MTEQNDLQQKSEANIAPEISIEDVDIHTMKKDQEELKKNGGNYIEKDLPLPETNTVRLQPSSPPTTSSSPFLKEYNSKPQAPSNFQSSANTPAKSYGTVDYSAEISENPSKITSSEVVAKSKPAWGKVFLAAISLAVIIALAAGGYYIWITKQDPTGFFTADTQPEETPMPVPETPEKTPEPEKQPDFSTENPNFLNIDVENSDTQQIKLSIEERAKKIIEFQSQGPIEFIIADKNNIPVPFALFAEKLGIILPKEVISNAKEGYSLFIYNDTGTARTALAIDISNQAQPEAAMLRDEPVLAKNLAPLFLETDYTIENKPFSTGDHKEQKIRFLNILSPKPLSIDYAFLDEDSLIIGTSKMSLRSVIDYLTTAGTDLPDNDSSLLEE